MQIIYDGHGNISIFSGIETFIQFSLTASILVA